ncbi:uncharacterized protein LOC129586803 [Paramacrobiotus metropolitanus]|uniref:uncharacterized protein LOC129586803 n=1 Tax=Paramacrobiotus metropolitanus TaxID=2943436 RepID=UPI00244639F6|nr:uncharacterized protein LOC129586803 [Paramacrobiotus metropolitanus]
MTPITTALNRLSLVGKLKKDKKPVVASSSSKNLRPASAKKGGGVDDDRDDCQRRELKKEPDIWPNQYPGLPCRTEPIDNRLRCPGMDEDSVNTFLRPDNLLLTEINVKLDQTRPYLVGNKLMKEIPLRDTTKQLNDKELRCLHWVVGESVERHAERTARYFANLFRSREHTDVIVYVGDNKIKAHKLVLAAFSPRLNQQFMKERPDKLLMPEICIDVSQLQTRALLRCIEFMYKGTTEIHHYNAADILNVAQALKIFGLAQMCKDKLKSLQYSDLLFKPPKDKCEAIIGELSRPRPNEDVKPKKLASKKSDDDMPPCNMDNRICPSPEDAKRREEALAMGSGPVDFYQITAQPAFLAWPIETVEALFSNDNLRLNSELDIVEAMVTWIQFRPDQRRQYAERLLDNVRFIHCTPHEMLDCKNLIPELFDMGPLRARMAKAKWMKDLVERGMSPPDLQIPPCRVNREGYWAEPDPCDTPVDNIYGETLPKEGHAPLAHDHRPQFKAGRAMVSQKAHKLMCDQIERQNRAEGMPPCSAPE